MGKLSFLSFSLSARVDNVVHMVRGQRQTMNHIVDTCSLTKSEGRLNLLHEAENDASEVTTLWRYINLFIIIIIIIIMPGIYSDCNYVMERGLVVGLILWSTTLLLPTLLSDSQVSISLVIHSL